MKYASFGEFYPYYLSEHRRSGTRRLHFAGTLLVLVTLGCVAATQRWVFLWLLPLFGYGFAWLGHFAVERNRPATFRHPLYSLIGDWHVRRHAARPRAVLN